ncbi:MAG: sulfite exporter TauE/SafE family protein [Parvularculaceae bacterium]|nr:sulfite exporter TauE/SafE family protein [Amphiplicatus sp.]HRX39312.1 sulfite exporter TauE/SafE family protein [Parvularculaceae bacterium]
MDILSSLTPEGVSPIIAALVVFTSFFTSALTASFGLGGGLALLAVMSALLPPIAVIPVHGVAQLGANFSRFTLQRRDVVWPIILWFALGGVLGTALGGKIYVALPEALLRAGVGLFVLFTVWGPKPKAFAPGPTSFFLTGALGAFLTMFFGATGPIAATMLSVTKLDRLKIVATHAACMVTQHALKTLAFGFLGFAFAHWALLIAAILIAGYLGAWSGVKLLRAMPEKQFRTGFRAVLTFFGVYLIAAGMYSALAK